MNKPEKDSTSNSGFFVAPEIEVMDLTKTGQLSLLYESGAGYTQIWRGEKAGKFIAYKALKPEFRGEVLYETLLLKDFKIGYTLDHPNVCRYYGFCELPDLGNAIEMEWIDGRTLEEYSLSERPDGGERRRIVMEICEALSYIHRRQVIHRDLKPSNILVTNNGGFVKIIDFGLSDSDSFATLKSAAGTRAYAAPEMLAEGGIVDCRSDIWSLGKVISEFAPEYKSVARRCMAAEPARRYENAERVLRAVEARSSRRIAVIAAIAVVMIAAAYVAFTKWLPGTRGEAGEAPVPAVVSPDTAVVTVPADTPAEASQETAATRESSAPAPKPKAAAAKPTTSEKPEPEPKEQKSDGKATLTQDDLDAIFHQATSAMEEGTK